MHIVWLFEIVTQDTSYYLSTDSYTYNTNSYSPLIDSQSFSGINILGEQDNVGLVTPQDLSFKTISTAEIVDKYESATGLTVSDVNSFLSGHFKDQECTIRLLVDDTLHKTWSFRIKKCNGNYGQAEFWLTSLLSSYLEGDHPNSRHPREVWPSDDPEKDPDDDYVIPLAFGDAYIPLRSVNTGSDRYYVLGPSGNTYSISEVQSPKEWDNSSKWDSSYTYNQSTDNGYQLLQAIIADSDGDGTADANGLWKGGRSFLDMPTRFTSSEISASADVNPADVVSKIIQDMGVDASYIDSAGTFQTAANQYDTWGIAWNGGFYKAVPRERRLASLQVQCASSIQITDKVELHPRSTTSQGTINSSHVKNFRYRPVWPRQNDGGYVEWVPEGTPQDQPQEALVWCNTTQSSADDVTEPESTRVDARLINDSQIAQRVGILWFNRQLDKNGVCTFTIIPNKSFLSLKPTDIVTLDHDLYGETRNVLIRSIKFNKDCSLELECIEFKNGVLGFDDVTPPAISIVSDDSEAWETPTESGVPKIGIKPNTTNFSTSSNGYAYIHGYNVHGEKVDKDGKIIWSGEEYTVPRDESSTGWTLTTSQEYNGYIVFDTTKSGKFTATGGTSHSVAFCKRESNTWYYDDGAAWQEITLSTDNDVVIGELSRGSTAITSATVWYGAKTNALIPNQDADDIALQNAGWMFDGEFSSADADTVSWTAGTWTKADGTTYSIDAGNTGNMGGRTWIYFQPSVATNTFQTTVTAADAVGSGKTLVGVAENNANGAWFFIFSGPGGQKITGDFIVGNTITGNHMVANTLTASEIDTGSINIGDWDGDLDDVDNGYWYGKIRNTQIDSNGIVILSAVSGDSDDIAEGSSHYFAGASGADFRKAVDDLDDISDGTNYGRVSTGSLTAEGLILLSSVSGDADDISEGTSNKFASESGADVTANNPQGSSWLTDSTDIVFANDSITRLTDLVLDNIGDGADYARVKSTDISSGHIILSSVTGTIDDVDEGTTYGKVKQTQISAGEILLGAASGDLDDIEDGTNYGKVSLTSISGGKIILSGCDGDADDISEGTSNKFAAESGAVKNFSSLTDNGGTLTLSSAKLVIDSTAGMESGNFVSGSNGWQINAAGDAEFNDVTVRGDIYYGDGTLIDNLQPAEPGSDETSSHADQIHHIGTTAPSSPNTGWYWTDTSVSPAELKRYDGAAWNRIATLGAKFGDTIEGGGSGNNQVGNDGYISSLHAGIVVAGTISTDKLDFGVVDDTNLTSGQYNFSSIYDDGGTLTISSSKLTISTSNGLEITTGGGMVVDADEGILVKGGVTGGITVEDGGSIRIKGTFSSLDFDTGSIAGDMTDVLSITTAQNTDREIQISAGGLCGLWSQDKIYLAADTDFTNDNALWVEKHATITKLHIQPNSDGDVNLGNQYYAWNIGYIQEIQNPNGDLYLNDTVKTGTVYPDGDGTQDIGKSTAAYATGYIETLTNPNGNLEINDNITFDTNDNYTIGTSGLDRLADVYTTTLNVYSINSLGTEIGISGHAVPAYAGGSNLGSSSLYWGTVNCSTLDDSHAAFMSEYDCLSILQAQQPLKDGKGNTQKTHGGIPRLDKRSLPDWLTNKERIWNELQKETAGKLTYEEFEQKWKDGEFAGKRDARDVFHTLDVAIGAIIQLNQKIENLEKNNAS